MRRFQQPTPEDKNPPPVDEPLRVPAIIQARLTEAEVLRMRQEGHVEIVVVVTLQSVVGAG
jgi:hypothetical protein